MTGMTTSGAGGTNKALFLKVYAGEVLTEFEEASATFGRHIVRTIEHGKSAQFPIIGRTEAYYHTPGEEITGKKGIAHGEIVITIDDLLIASVFIANIDEAMASYDMRSIYTKECGRALARKFDENVLRSGLGFFKDNKKNPFPMPSKVGNGIAGKKARLKEDIKEAVALFFQAAEMLDTQHVPSEDRYLYVRPDLYYALVSDTSVINKDWGGEGSYSAGTVKRLAGFELVKTNHLPREDTTTDTTGNVLPINCKDLEALAMHKSAVGTVKLMDIATETDYLVQYQGDLIVSKMAVGHGLLRLESSVPIFGVGGEKMVQSQS